MVCKYTINTKEFECNNVITELRSFSNCNTSNVVYCIKCPCGLPYIGQTTQAVKNRIGQHRSRIRCKTENAPLVAHFVDMGHTAEDLVWQVIEVVGLPDRGGDLSQILLRKECKWITKCRSIDGGLNSNEEWNNCLL